MDFSGRIVNEVKQAKSEMSNKLRADTQCIRTNWDCIKDLDPETLDKQTLINCFHLLGQSMAAIERQGK
jgi:hypothetical protein